MGIFENFPYTNFHELNLDWILSTIKELDSEIDEFVQTNVLTYAEPIQWNITTQYAKNTVVVGPDGTAYMSIAPVPTNILLTNTDYWQPIFNYSETVTVLKKQIAAADMGDSKTALVSVPLGGLFWQINTLYRAKKAISEGDGFVTGSNCELCTVEDAIKNVIAPASDIGRSGKNVSDSATETATRTAGSIIDSATETAKRTAGSIIDSATDTAKRTAGSIIDSATETAKRTAGSIIDSATETAKRTGRNIIDTAAGDYTETSNRKTIEAAQITEHTTGNREIDVDGASSIHIDGTSTVNVGGDHTEVYTKTYGKRITGKRTVNFDGGSEEIHKTKGKITAPDFELAITNGLTYKKPVAYNDYFSSVPMKDTDGNVYQVLVSNDSTSGLGSAAPYHSYKEFGIDNTGTIDCSDALAGVTDNVALSAGTYLVSKNCTISAQLAFAKGAKLKVGTGVTVSITGYITAPACEIFTGDGTVSYTGIAIADWYSSLNKAYDGCNNIRLLPHSYTLAADLILSRSNSSIIGPGFTTPFTSGCVINAGNHKIQLGNGTATAINDFTRSIDLQNFALVSSHATPIFFDCALQCNVSGLYIQSSGGSCMILNRAIACVIDNCYLQSIQTEGSSFFAIQIQNTSGDLNKRNASITISRVNASFDGTATHNNSYGIRITTDGNTGTKVSSDIYITQCEFNRFTSGISYSTTDSEASINIHLTRVIVDQCTGQAFWFLHIKKGTVQIHDCYATNRAGNIQPMLTVVQSPITFYINGLEMYSVTNTHDYAMIGTDGNFNVLGSGLIMRSIGGGSIADPTFTGSYDLYYINGYTIKHLTSV